MKQYRELLGLSHVKILILSALPARISYGMISLAIFFKAEHETQSISFAGLAIGLYALASSLCAGVRGTWVDRYGQKWPLAVLVPSFAAMLFLLNLTHSHDLMLLFSFFLGATAPPINLSIRPIWKEIVPEELLRTAYALDTSVISTTGVLGPIFATTLSLSAHPGSALNICAILILLGGLALALTKVSREWTPEARGTDEKPVWRHPAMRLLMFEGCFIGFGMGAFNVGVPSFAILEKCPGRTAWILGAMGVCNIVGGLLGGLVSKNSPSLLMLRKSYGLWFLVSLPLAITYPGWSMAIAGAFLGLVAGAIQVFYWEVMEAVRPRGSATAALGWIWTVEGSFLALGSACGGWIAKEFSPRLCLALTSAAIGLGFWTINAGRSRLSAANKIPTLGEDLLAMSDNSPPTH